MPLQPAKNAAFVLQLLLRRQALAPPSRQSYTTSTILAYSTQSSSPSQSTTNSHAMSSDPFLEDENPLEYEDVRTALPERITTARPIPWPTVFAPKHQQDDQLHSAAERHRISVSDQALPCTPLIRHVLRKEYDAADQLLQEMNALDVPIKSRPDYLMAARARLLQSPPDKDGFLRFITLAGGTVDLFHSRLIAYLRETHTTDYSFFRRFILILAERDQIGEGCVTLLLHLAVVAPPAVTFDTLMEALKLDRAARLKTGQAYMSPERRSNVWHRVIQKVAAAGHREAARRMFHQMEDGPEPIRFDPLTKRILKKPSFQRIQGFPTPNPDDTPTRWLIRRMRYAVKERVTPRALRGILEDIGSLDPARPSLYDRFRSRFIRDRLVAATSELSQDIWTADQARRVWTQAEIMRLQRQGRHDLAISYFRGRCVWYGMPSDPRIEAFPVAANPFSRSERPNIALNNIILRSVLEILPRNVYAIRKYYHRLLEMTGGLSPSVRPDTYTHGIFASFVQYHFGERAAANMLHRAKQLGHVVGTYPFERILELAAWRGEDIERENGLLRAMQNGHAWMGLWPGQPSAIFYEHLRNIKRQRGPRLLRAKRKYRRKAERNPPVVTLRKTSFWEPEWLEDEAEDGHEDAENVVDPLDEIIPRRDEGSHGGERAAVGR